MTEAVAMSPELYQQLCQESPYMWHAVATTADCTEKVVRILEEGLRPRAATGQPTLWLGLFRSRPTHVYASARPSIRYGLPLLAIDLRQLDPDTLEADEDLGKYEDLGLLTHEAVNILTYADIDLGEWASTEPRLATPEMTDASYHRLGTLAIRGEVPPAALILDAVEWSGWQEAEPTAPDLHRFHNADYEAFMTQRATEGPATLRQLGQELILRVLHDAPHNSVLHGLSHWERVARNGAAICARTPSADPDVVLLFALLHDSQRRNDHHDPEHGPRAAAYADRLHNERLLKITAAQHDQLRHACAHHTDGNTSTDPTIGACYDADRLDLPRVGITPNPELMTTKAGKTMARTNT